MQNGKHRVVIVGAGFGGLYAAKALRHADIDLTIVDRRNFHLFQPLLYQVATGVLSPANIAAPVRAILKRNRNTRTLLGEVTGVDIERSRLNLKEGAIEFDSLILAPGSETSYFGNDGWAEIAPGLKTVEDATRIRARILAAFEQAELEQVPDRIRRLLTFVVAGGGPTGVELAGAIAEIARHTLTHEFRTITPADSRILLVQGGERLLQGYPEELSANAQRSLEKLGVEILLKHKAVDVSERGALIRNEAGEEQFVESANILWATGVKASPLGAALRDATGCELDRAGRVKVLPDCSIAGHPNIFVVGDMASLDDAQGRPLPGVAQVAMQQAAFAGRLVVDRVKGRATNGRKFSYRDRGSMATIGRASAVADLGSMKLTGMPGWLAWLFIHLMYIVEYDNRVLVLFQWCWYYLTWNRSARLITNPEEAKL
ncbi:MAG: NAD(P)/FAD-dependent oxidoreductase [Planctomycetales bacterium]|nr:NAD(P)/FAD-dependent oxidoreductase [bacterium]UNM07521.1 MAG: NAD(P)/FAD-dependent oxidoreductase [Planctomycetales bacterium]